MFDPSRDPRVFGVPPGADFPRTLAQGVLARLADAPPEALARVEIVVNTERMGRRLASLFTDLRPGLLPRITPIARLSGRWPVSGIPPLRPPLRRKLDLARLVSGLIAAQPDLAPRAAVQGLADSLAALFDEIQGEGVDPGAIFSLPVEDVSGHWGRSLAFLRIVAEYLEDATDGAADAEERLRQTVTILAESWLVAPPSNPVIVAGSTGSRGTTAHFMQAVARLPQGAVVLPGFDFHLPRDLWPELIDGEDHPQARFARLLAALDLPVSSVVPWASVREDTDRNRLVSLALRPAPVTDQWLRDGPSLGPLNQTTAALSLIEAPSPRVEAQAIALRLRKAAEEGQVAALISPDRMLTRQVAAALGRWGIEPDDSAGRPLALSAPGRYLRLVAVLFEQRVGATDLIALLKHPLTSTGCGDRGGHLRRTREFELSLRKGAVAFATSSTLHDFAASRDEDSRIWADWLAGQLGAGEVWQERSLGEFLERHLAVAETLAAGPGQSGPGALWQKAAGESARAAMDDLRSAASDADRMTLVDYRATIESLLQSREVRDPISAHPAIMIWGTLEARVQGADLVILGGLNDGVWPEHPGPDPWLNRAMRRQAGLLLPERRIGLSAHDFQQAIAAREVVLSRARRDADSETIPSRWLNRLANLLSGLHQQGGPKALAAMRARGAQWIEAAQALDHAAQRQRAAQRPSPQPPLSARPSQLSVTEIEKLLRDPYAIYGRRVLGLRRLEPFARRPDAALRGTVLHAIVAGMLVAIVEDGFDPGRSDAATTLAAIADRLLEDMVPWPATRRLWRGRFLRVMPRLLAGEGIRLSEGVPYLPERKGSLTFADLGFTLTGVADRIDRRHDGTLAIYDYKTGAIPNDKVVRFFNRQLPLEAVMAEAGAFEGVSPGIVSHLGYVALGPSSADRGFSPVDAYATDVVAEEFRRLLMAYRDRRRGYTSRRSVTSTHFEGDYDHLARYGEWDASDDPLGENVG